MKQLKVLILTLVIVIATNSLVYADYNKFVDVDETSWYYDAVVFVYEKGYFVGTSEEHFSPADNMTRGMLAAVLGRMANADITKYNNENTAYFSDITSEDWHFSYVNWAADNRLINGYEDKTFRGNNNITREETAVIIGRYLKSLGVELKQNEYTISEFIDGDQISTWALEDIELLRDKGIIVGNENGEYMPQKYITRAELSIIIMRLKYVIEEIVEDDIPLVTITESEDTDGETTDSGNTSGGGSSGNGGGSTGGNNDYTYLPAITENSYGEGTAFTIGADISEHEIILAEVIEEVVDSNGEHLYSIDIELDIYDDASVEFILVIPTGASLVTDTNSLMNNRFSASEIEYYFTTLEISADAGTYAEIQMYYYVDDTPILAGIKTIKF